MGHRRNVSTYKQKAFEPPPSPNATVAAISVDIRVFFPPNATAADILPVLHEAMDEVESRLIKETQ